VSICALFNGGRELASTEPEKIAKKKQKTTWQKMNLKCTKSLPKMNSTIKPTPSSRPAWWVDVKTYLTCMKWLENGGDIHSRV
jgi:hypothetical protein